MGKNLKRTLALLLTLLLAFSASSLMAMAAGTAEDPAFTGAGEPEAKEAVPFSTVSSGTCGDHLTWVLDDGGTLTISGTGEMNNYRTNTQPWTECRDSIKTVIIEEGVTDIGNYAFSWCTEMQEVEIPGTVNRIGGYAFYNCSSLTELTIPDGVTAVGDSAFFLCEGLTRVVISDSVTSMGSNVFSQCSRLQSVQLSNSLTSISYGLFHYCYSLSSIVIPDGVTTIESFSFDQATGLTTIQIPLSVTDIEYCAFQGCGPDLVYYGGSAEDWNAIEIGIGNTSLSNASFIYNVKDTVTGRIDISRLSITSGGVEVTWNADFNAQGYNIYRRAGENGTFSLIGTVAGWAESSYLDAEVKNGETYYYYIQAYAGNFISEQGLIKYITYMDNLVTDMDGAGSEATRNSGAQDYGGYPNYTGTDYSSPVYSYLETVDDGYMRVEYTGNAIAVEYYDSAYNLTGKKSVAMELPIFGGFYAGDDAYYLVVGQENDEEDDNREVFRIIKYSKDWERLDQASIYGAYTTVPFNCGSCRMDEGGGYLYIRTSHQMYTYVVDGLRHQANVTIIVQESDMSVIYIYYDIANSSVGYVSHSFNQFVLVDDEDNVIALDHGDAVPRAMVLFKFDARAGDNTFDGRNQRINLISFQGFSGKNYTGASIGGLEYSDTSYLVAGNSVVQDDDWLDYYCKNVFISVTDRDDFTSDGTEIKWITDFDPNGSVSASTPQLVKISGNSFLLLWTTMENKQATGLQYVFLDGRGNMTSEIYTADGALSDCQPIVDGEGSVTWYVTGEGNTSSIPTFYTIDTSGNLTARKTAFTGFGEENGSWYYYVDGKVNTSLNGVLSGTINGTEGRWYVVGGKAQLNDSGLCDYADADGNWWYVTNGRVDTTFSGLVQNSYGWWYIENGTCSFNWTGLTQNEYGWWYIENSRCNFNWTGLTQNEYGWWYVENSRCNFNWTGLTQNEYGWWYIENSRCNFNYTGLVQNAYGWWYVQDSYVPFTFTGLVQNEYGWWYVQDSHVTFTYTGPVQNEYGWWYIEDSHCNFNYNGTVGGHTFVNSHAV